MASIINALNESAVTYVPDVERYGWAYVPGTPRDGWEAASPTGEVRCFATREAAHAWRIAEVLEYVAYLQTFRLTSRPIVRAA